MSDVCVVTGGGSGMGLSAALQMQKDKIIIPIPAMNERKSMTTDYLLQKRNGILHINILDYMTEGKEFS